MCEVCSQKPDNRTEGQLEGRVSSSSGTDPRDRNFLMNVITGDATWIFEYDPETKRQSKEWHTSASPRLKKARKSKSKIKSMLFCFFDSDGIVHTEFVPQGHTVNQFYYREILERLRKRVVRVRPSIADNWMSNHDNAPCHTAISVIEFLAEKGIPPKGTILKGTNSICSLKVSTELY